MSDFIDSQARVSYIEGSKNKASKQNFSSGDSFLQIGLTTANGPASVVSKAKFSALFADQKLKWIVYLLGVMLTVGLPAYFMKSRPLAVRGKTA